ncbi:hypothetical protein N7461_003490 [Penicillium sp. DV-2018c]|nr:hypothetical protein N7461_003490 [Penicillium sp. DV-2018c]
MTTIAACTTTDLDLAHQLTVTPIGVRLRTAGFIPGIGKLTNATEVTMTETIIALQNGDHRLVEVETRTETVIERDTRAAATVAAAALVKGMDMTEQDISAELENAYHIDGLEDIRVIRDRQTKLSRQLGFLRFSTIEASRAFVERNMPYIYLYGPSAGAHDRSTKVRIAYSREREDRARPKGTGDWNCRNCFIINFSTRPHCFKCGNPRPNMDPTGPPGIPSHRAANDGDSDAAPENQPSQFLLIRGLEASVTEELLAKGVAKLYRPSSTAESAPGNPKKGAKVTSTTDDRNLGAREGSLRRVLLVRDRKTNESWRYGFAEFAGLNDAQAAMARFNSFDRFTISSKPVLVTYIHGGVFVPVINPSAGATPYTFSPSNNPSLQLMYWDDAAYVTELKLSTEEDDAAQEQSGTKTASNKQDAQGKVVKDSDKTKKRKAESTASTNTKKLAMPSQLQFWSNRHAELHGINRDDGDNTTEAVVDQDAPMTDQGAPPAAFSASPAGPVAGAMADSYLDMNNICCHLCVRQFATAEDLHLHEQSSELHQENLQDEDARVRGNYRLVKFGLAPCPSPVYRFTAEDFAGENSSTSIPEQASSYADMNRLVCTLCQTQFISREAAIWHDRLSVQHQENLKKPTLRDRALRELIERGVVEAPQIYRDRAKERRQTFGPRKSGAAQTSYADLKELRCLLCWWKFTSAEALVYHERHSAEHQENLQKEERRADGDCRLIKYGYAPLPNPVYRCNPEDLGGSDSPPYSSYADLETKCCYLCWKEFPSPEETLRHERIDDLHRTNLKIKEKREKGMRALVTRGLVKLPQNSQDSANESLKATGPDEASVRQQSVQQQSQLEPPAQTSSIGASLLSKMGWKEGSGLGADGAGVTAPISTDVYAPGVGLGAQGGRLGDAAEEAGRNTRGRYDEFLQKTKDNARQRFEGMDKS